MYNLSDFELKKLKHDPFYWSMLDKGYSYEEIKKSGWINTSYSHEDNLNHLNIFTSCFEHLLSEEPFILLNTGSYAPAHEGHLEMMQVAKQCLENNGFKIDALVMSPSHDGYVLTKSSDIACWNIYKRLNALQEKIANFNTHNKLKYVIDTWESLYCSCPVNFTDVILHIAHDLTTLGYKNYKIGYVFGSDNHSFTDCFFHLPDELKEKFYAICVNRCGFEIKTSDLKKSSNIFYTDMQKHGQQQSRVIRKEQLFKPNFGLDNFSTNENDVYAVRNDQRFALSHWIEKYPNEKLKLEQSFEKFHIGLCVAIKKATSVDCISINAQEQQTIVEEIIEKEKVINLDICTNHLQKQNALNLCRIFSIGDFQTKACNIIQRPEQINDFKSVAGTYSFIDDDIASGRTLEFVKEYLKNFNITIDKQYNLAQLYCEKNSLSTSFYDIVDTRDFLFGSFAGGLVCLFNKTYCRIPYLMPWVNLHTRAKINHNKLIEFSLDILKLNIEFFEENDFLSFEDFKNKDFFLFQHSSKNICAWCKEHYQWLENHAVKC